MLTALLCRETLFRQYTALQAELERKVEETVGRPWHEVSNPVR